MTAVRWVWVPLTIIGIAMIAWGIHLGRHTIVEQQAKALCTTCIGLTLE
ncbi:MAG: thioredoxin [Armatimonadota bacterium]|jgi:hypothetical protein